MKIIVTTHNKLKIRATQKAFEKVFPGEVLELEQLKVSSGVSDQPMSEEETLQGAKNRAESAKTNIPDADYYVGLEGGIREINDDMVVFGYVYILDKEDRYGYSRSIEMLLPREIANLIKTGVELGDADDQVFKRKDSKKTNGSVGLLTNDLITRVDTFVDSTVVALIPFIHPNLYN